MFTPLPNEPDFIYVSLLNDGTNCWRPVEAVQINKNIYRITNPSIEDEQWQFETGDVVRCRERVSPNNELFLEAYELAPQD